MNEKLKFDKKIGILDWGIVLSVIILFLMIYIPNSIWKEENKLKDISRFRMEVIANSQEFYYELTGSYTYDGQMLFNLVEAAMDSLIADTLFTGSQLINIKDTVFTVNVESDFAIRVDTTFSFPVDYRRAFQDTIYSISMLNENEDGYDTLFVNAKNIEEYKSEYGFDEIIDLNISNRSEIFTDYLRKKFHLDKKYLSSPIVNEPYIFSIDSSSSEDVVFTVSSPLSDKYKERRYIIFNFQPGKVRFDWDLFDPYIFARVKYRVDTSGSLWQNVGGFGIYYPLSSINAFGLLSGVSYRGHGRLFCDSNITAYRSPSWTNPPIFWSQPNPPIKLVSNFDLYNFNITPNPSNGNFNIEYNLDFQTDLVIKIFNTIGEKVYENTCKSCTGELNLSYNLKELESSVYFVSIDNGKTIKTKKIIIE